MHKPRTTFRIILAVVLMSAIAGLVAPDIRTQQTSEGSEPYLVKLSFMVTDSSGRASETVRREDVQVLQDGVPQPISFFAKDERPVSYGIVIDRSGSFRFVLQSAIDAAKVIVKSNRTQDETFVESFVSSDKIETVDDFTADKERLTDGLDTLLSEGGQSAIIDAVYLGVEHLAKRRAGKSDLRRALVLITDGDDRSSFYQLAALEKLIREKDVQIFVIGFVSEVKIKPTSEERAKGYRSRAEAVALLTRLAEVSGGRVFLLNNEVAAVPGALEISRNLHSQYLVSYQPTRREQGPHRITVEITPMPGKDKLNTILRPSVLPQPRAKDGKPQ